MKGSNYLLGIFILFAALVSAAQRPPGGPPQGPRPPRPERPDRPPGERGEWFETFDTNKDQKLDRGEVEAAANATFDTIDRDHSGVLDAAEMPPPHHHDAPPAPGQMDMRGGDLRSPRPDDSGRLLPPFFFMKDVEPGATLSKADFLTAVRSAFAEMDGNADGFLTREEARPDKGHGDAPRAPGPPPPPPNAEFIGAELRFGDKLVKDQPFSATTIIEDNRRLFDGSTVSTQSKGAVYRDTAGRTRREQPMDNVGGFSIVASDSQPATLVFINDLSNGTQYFLDLKQKVARRTATRDDRAPEAPKSNAPDTRSESLGTREIEGLSCQGTRTTFEIPVGRIGNPKPIAVTYEKWFSPELGIVIYSRHLDPLSGEHIFKLINIKRAEPAAELFTVPAGFRIENGRTPRPEEE